jgi:hypothetical protein
VTLQKEITAHEPLKNKVSLDTRTRISNILADVSVKQLTATNKKQSYLAKLIGTDLLSREERERNKMIDKTDFEIKCQMHRLKVMRNDGSHVYEFTGENSHIIEL